MYNPAQSHYIDEQQDGKAGRLLPNLIVVEWRQNIVQHLLVEHRGDAPGHWGDQPNPVCRAASSGPVLILHVLHEGLGSCVVVHDGHILLLVEKKREWAERRAAEESGGRLHWKAGDRCHGSETAPGPLMTAAETHPGPSPQT